MFDQPSGHGTDASFIRSLPRPSASKELLCMIRTRLVPVLLAAAAFAAAAGPASAAPDSGKGPDKGGSAQSAHDDHKPAGTGSGRKIG
jgi:hypothetical protein